MVCVPSACRFEAPKPAVLLPPLVPPIARAVGVESMMRTLHVVPPGVNSAIRGTRRFDRHAYSAL